MKTDASGTSIRIEKEGYAPVIKRTLQKPWSLYDLNPWLDLTESKERAIGGWLLETHLPDGTVVESF
jgi:hypothetical protein